MYKDPAHRITLWIVLLLAIISTLLSILPIVDILYPREVEEVVCPVCEEIQEQPEPPVIITPKPEPEGLEASTMERCEELYRGSRRRYVGNGVCEIGEYCLNSDNTLWKRANFDGPTTFSSTELSNC